MGTQNLWSFFNPEGVAVIGASDTRGKLGHEILKNLVEGGFPGALYPINPKTERILGLQCHQNVKDIRGPVDMAVVIIPARFVAQAIRDCAERGVKGAVIVAYDSMTADARAFAADWRTEAAAASMSFCLSFVRPVAARASTSCCSACLTAASTSST